MADSPAFSHICEKLEQATSLDRLEARGTVRLALKRSGLEARTVTAAQLTVVATKVLPPELTTRGVERADEVCAQLVSQMSEFTQDATAETPDAVFARLGQT